MYYWAWNGMGYGMYVNELIIIINKVQNIIIIDF